MPAQQVKIIILIWSVMSESAIWPLTDIVSINEDMPLITELSHQAQYWSSYNINSGGISHFKMWRCGVNSSCYPLCEFWSQSWRWRGCWGFCFTFSLYYHAYAASRGNLFCSRPAVSSCAILAMMAGAAWNDSALSYFGEPHQRQLSLSSILGVFCCDSGC